MCGLRSKSRFGVYLGLLTAALLIASSALAVDDVRDNPDPQAKQSILVVVGAAGTDEYRSEFMDWCNLWRRAAQQAGAEFDVIGGDSSHEELETVADDRDRLRDDLAARAAEESAVLWIVLIGHGTFDGQAAKFNLSGPDLTAAELAEWLRPHRRPVVVVNCASSSAPFINRLAGGDRVVITATKSGHEQNFARFGKYFSAAISDPTADLDKDDQVSLLEAFLTACRQVAEFYQQESRLATEHALLDDNGDGLGTPAVWFRGLRATQRAKDDASLDGTRAHQIHLIPSDREQHMPPEVRNRRNQIELAIAELRLEKERLSEDAYYEQLERQMVELARLYASIQEETASGELTPDQEVEPTAKVDIPADSQSAANSGEAGDAADRGETPPSETPSAE